MGSVDNSPYEYGWNLNKGYYDHVCELIVTADAAAYSERPQPWYKLLRMIFRKVEERMDKPIVKELITLFDEAKAIIDDIPANPNSKELQSIYKANTETALDKLDMLERKMLAEMHRQELLPTAPHRTDPNSAVEDMGPY